MYKGRNRKRAIWFLLGVLTFFLIRLASRHPEMTESVYGGFLYPAIRGVFRYTLGLLPFASLYILGILAIILLYRTAIRPLARKEWDIRSFLAGLLSTVAAVYCLFYFLWGFNYSRPGVLDRIGLEVTKMDSADLRKEFDVATAELIDLLERDGKYLPTSYEQRRTPPDAADVHRPVGEVLTAFGYKSVPRPRGRLLLPKGILLRFATAGIYIPFSGEGHVDHGMHNVQIPFTMAHELAHGFGVTDEGECNFVAYVACRRSPDPSVRFSGLLSYWRYVAFDYRRQFPDDFKKAYAGLPDYIKQIQKEISENNALYPDIMPKVRNAVYDSYLKSNGVKEGIVSYGRMTRMVEAYRKSPDSLLE